VNFVGSGGGFSCFAQYDSSALPTLPPLMLWIAGGVGITPFMSMWDGILAVEKALAGQDQHIVTDIVLVFAARADELALLRHFLQRRSTQPDRVRMSILGFQSSGLATGEGAAINPSVNGALAQDFPDAALAIEQRRIDKSGLATIDRLSEREVFLCGPDGFMRHTQALLESIVGADLNLHTESYSF